MIDRGLFYLFHSDITPDFQPFQVNYYTLWFWQCDYRCISITDGHSSLVLAHILINPFVLVLSSHSWVEWFLECSFYCQQHHSFMATASVWTHLLHADQCVLAPMQWCYFDPHCTHTICSEYISHNQWTVPWKSMQCHSQCYLQW